VLYAASKSASLSPSVAPSGPAIIIMYFTCVSSRSVRPFNTRATYRSRPDRRPGTDSAPPDGMTDHESESATRRTPSGALEGTDAGALGTDTPPTTAPPGAQVDASEHLVPGAKFDQGPKTDAKPWFTSLGAESDQAGVANDDPDAQEPAFPADAESPREP
jgi:hypothetical protein